MLWSRLFGAIAVLFVLCAVGAPQQPLVDMLKQIDQRLFEAIRSLRVPRQAPHPYRAARGAARRSRCHFGGIRRDSLWYHVRDLD